MASVHAVVVAVEDYRAGRVLPPLRGPAADAARYLTWLRERGVPDESVTLFASPLPGGPDFGLVPRPARQQELYDFLTGELPSIDAEQLVLMWGGHGAVDADGRRRLFYADATVDDKRNLDFNELTRSLTTTYFPRLRRGLLIVDACQNEARFANRLPHQALPSGSQLVVGRSQDVLFAAGPGQLAANDSRRAAGLFSEELLRLLRDPATPFPPDADRLASRIRRRFAELRVADATAQMPQYLWHRTGDREGLDVVLGAPQPGRNRIPLRSLGAIVDEMTDVDELASVPGLQRLVALLPKRIRSAVPYTGVPRTDLIQLVRTCEWYTEGREALVVILATALADREGCARVLAAIDAHWPQP
ncbi:effector-associated domain 2-containing protein [Dactylosporangium sp. CA-092794]|uniref:effector-associated domain 2-containing protein n=1 Tax=Dactylosporangium sp. CA-092794 TaxID=3239929 RepID=UPI003D91B0D7